MRRIKIGGRTAFDNLVAARDIAIAQENPSRFS